MLVITRKVGQVIHVGDDITITVVHIRSGQVQLAIEAPNEIKIYRDEIYRRILEERRQAAAAQRTA